MRKDTKLAFAQTDARMSAAAECLGRLGWEITELTGDGAAVILPMPYTRDGVTVGNTGVPINRLFEKTGGRRPVLGGMLDKKAYCAALENGVRLFDYFSPEWVKTENAALTARAATELDCVIKKLAEKPNVLICGFGRIGKFLTALLPDAAVSARSENDLAWIRSLGHEGMRTDAIDTERFSLIFNTIPSRHLEGEKLEKIPRGAVIVDLASAPYGTDHEACGRLGINAVTAPSLPARAYPEKSGEILARSIDLILRSGEAAL